MRFFIFCFYLLFFFESNLYFVFLYIKGEILRYIRENKVMKVSKDVIKLNSLINKTKDALQQKYDQAHLLPR